MQDLRNCIAVLVGAALVSLAAPAHAQGAHAQGKKPAGESHAANGDADRRARALYREGDRLYVQGKYEEAIAAFQQSYRLSNRPLILYAIANAYERMGRYEEALRSLREYEPHAKRSEEVDLQERIRSLEQRLETQPRAQEAATEGPPVVAVARAGGGARESSRPLAGWLLAGAGAASLATGAALGIVSWKAKDDIGDRCQDVDGAPLCLADTKTLIRRNWRYARFADVGMAAGAAVLIAGVVVLVTGGGDVPAEQPVLSFGPGRLEVGFAGRF